ncbi:MAG: sulfatase [Thermodesulfobacteriota bacterium]
MPKGERGLPGRGAARGQRASAALWLIVLIGLSAGAVAVVTVGVRRAPRPNLVLVVVDALRRDHVGVYNYPRPVTPFLDDIAQRGVVFDNAWSHAPQTLNSTAALLTGQVSPLLVRRNARPEEMWTVFRLADQNVTLAEMLAAAGYDTLGIFTNPHHAPESTFAQGMRLHRYLPGTSAAHGHALAEEVNSTALSLIGELDPSRPFFAYVHYMDVHNPYLPPEDQARLFVTVQGRDMYRNGKVDDATAPRPRDLRYMIDNYDACIRYVDESLRDLFAMFDIASHGRNTIFVVTSDHGDEFMEHGGLGHGHTVYQELLRVPLIMHGGSVPGGLRVQNMARGIDVLPTLAELAGLEPSTSSEGLSLIPLIGAADSRGGGASASRATTREDPRGEPVFNFAWFSGLRSIASEDFHMPLNEERVLELYDVRSDAYDRRNVAAAHPKVVRRMRLKMHAYERHLRNVHRASQALGEDARALDHRTVEQLRMLGYVQ